MIPIVATEPDFVRKALIEQGSAPTLFLRFGILEAELLELLSSIDNPASSASQILSGLLNARKLTAIKASDMKKGLAPQMTSMKSEYIELSLMCGKHFVHWQEICENDVTEFSKYGIKTHHASNIRYDEINQKLRSNVMNSWTLSDGGSDDITQHVLEHLHFIGTVKIYDRYFNRLSLDTLLKLFSTYHGSFGLFPGRIDIYMGEKFGKAVTKSDVISELSQFVDGSKLSIMKCTKCLTSSAHVHDRWLQLDNEITFEFSAGLSCYYDNNGQNRASTVFQRSVVVDYTVVEMIDEFGTTVKFRV